MYVLSRSSLPSEPDCHLDYGGPDAWGIIRTSWREKPEDWDNTPYVWGDADSGHGVDAYIVDTGIRITHDDFEGQINSQHWISYIKRHMLHILQTDFSKFL